MLELRTPLVDDPLLAECWYVDLDDDVRRERLVRRHVQFGRAPDAAYEWVARSDEANARLVMNVRGSADQIVRSDVAPPRL